MKSMCKYWGLHISTNINCLDAVLNSFWEVWRGLLWCLKAKLRSWQFLRYWWFNKQYHGGYQLICLISWPLLITSRCDWYQLKCIFKGFWVLLILWESSKNWWRYGWMKFVTPRIRLSPNTENNTTHCCKDHCWKGAKWPDRQHYLISSPSADTVGSTLGLP